MLPDTTPFREDLPKQKRVELHPDTLPYTDDAGTLPRGGHTEYRTGRRTSYSSSSLAAHRAKHAKIIQSWEGVVSSIGEDSFQANMRLTESQNSRASEYFDIDIDNVSDGDMGLLREGAKFFLTVLSIVIPGEGSQKTTRLVFRRIPKMRASDLVDAEKEASELWEQLQRGYNAQLAEGA